MHYLLFTLLLFPLFALASFLTVEDGSQIFYKDWGNSTGLPIIFSHGWPLNADAWDSQMFFFANQGYRVIAYDRRGHGRSDQPWEGNDVDTWAGDLNSLMKFLNIHNATLVGHSTGGGEIVRYACLHGQDRIQKLVLMSAVVPQLLKTDAHPNGLPKSTLTDFRESMINDRAAFFYEVPSGPFFGFNRPNATVSEGLIESWFQQGMQASFKAVFDTVASWEIDYSNDLKALDVPVLIMQGDDDQVVPIASSAYEAIELVKDGTLKVYPGAPHAIPNINAEEVNHDLLAFLEA